LDCAGEAASAFERLLVEPVHSGGQTFSKQALYGLSYSGDDGLDGFFFLFGGME